VDDPCWRLPNTLELRLKDGEITVNGFPAPTAVGLWQRPFRDRGGKRVDGEPQRKADASTAPL
jgi:hypothetical protein